MAQALRTSKALAGAALIGFGIFMLYQNLARVLTRLSHLAGANNFRALGLLFALILAVVHGLQVQAPHQQWVVQSFVQQIFGLSWPLLFVMVGRVLSQDSLMGKVYAKGEKDPELVDLTAGGSTSKQRQVISS
jgi:hypothetical protein